MCPSFLKNSLSSVWYHLRVTRKFRIVELFAYICQMGTVRHGCDWVPSESKTRTRSPEHWWNTNCERARTTLRGSRSFGCKLGEFLSSVFGFTPAILIDVETKRVSDVWSGSSYRAANTHCGTNFLHFWVDACSLALSGSLTYFFLAVLMLHSTVCLQ